MYAIRSYYESGLEKDGIGVSYIKNILSTGNTDGDFLNSGAGTLYIYFIISKVVDIVK